MTPERARAFARCMREASRKALEASRELAVCTVLLDVSDPAEDMVRASLEGDRAVLEEMASRLEEAVEGVEERKTI